MKNINRDYLVKIDTKTAKLTPAPKELKFFMTDVLTSNIFFELGPKESFRESLTNKDLVDNIPSQNAVYYDLYLRVVKPNGEPKTIKAKQLANYSFYVADLTVDFVDIPGTYQCELFIDAETTNEDGFVRLERNTTEPFEYKVEPSIFYDISNIVDTKILAIEDIATVDYVDSLRDYVNSLAVGGVDLEGYATDEELNTKANIEHTHDDYITQTVLDEALVGVGINIDLENFVASNSISINRQEYTVIGQYSTAEGDNTTASGYASHAEGRSAKASGDASHAEGSNTTASDYYAHAEGLHSEASGEGSHAEGYSAVASGFYSHAEGFGTIARGNYQHAQGKYNIEDTSNTYAHIVGNGTSEARANIHTLNWDGDAWFAGNITVGNNNQVLATEEYVDQVAFNGVQYDDTGLLILIDAKADKDHTHDEYITREELDIIDTNIDNLVVNNSISMGRLADTTVAKYSVAEGSQVTATGYASHGEGVSTTASGYASHAEGESTIASKNHAHAEGYKSTANGGVSHAEGQNTIASGICSHAEGAGTIASGQASHAEGNAEARGEASHAEGNSTASGDYSHAEGQSTANGRGSHAEGISIASGDYSHAEGNSTEARGKNSHAEGYYTIATGSEKYPQHVQGKYNIEDRNNDYAHIVGNGSSNSDHSNAHTLDWDGNAWFAGNVKVGADNQVLATQDYVDDILLGITGGELDLSSYVTQDELDDALAGISGGESYDDTELRGLIADKADSDHTHDEYLTEIPAEYITQTEFDDALANLPSGGESYDDTELRKLINSKADKNNTELYGSVSIGNDCVAGKVYTVAIGEGAYCGSMNQIAMGSWNVIDEADKYAFIFGDGDYYDDEERRSNCMTIDRSGNCWHKGNIYVGSNSHDGYSKKVLTEGDIYFDSSGYLVVKINGTTKRFAPVE